MSNAHFTMPIKLGEAGELCHLPADLLAGNISSLITQQDGHHQDDLKEEIGATTTFDRHPLLSPTSGNPSDDEDVVLPEEEDEEDEDEEEDEGEDEGEDDADPDPDSRSRSRSRT